MLSENELDSETYEQLIIGKQINQAIKIQQEMIDTINYGCDIFQGMANNIDNLTEVAIDKARQALLAETCSPDTRRKLEKKGSAIKRKRAKIKLKM